jgi:hypothetical protein
MLDIPCLTKPQQKKLIEAAEQMALRFCAPVFLVGSAVSKMYPNDIDIYIAVTGESYLKLFTNYGKKTESETDHVANIEDMQRQQAKIYKKQKDYFESRVNGWDFDVKFQNKEAFLKHEGERIRLDMVFVELW